MVLNFEESSRDLREDFFDIAWMSIWFVIVIFAGFFSLTRGGAFEEEVNFTKFVLFGVMILAFWIFAIVIKFAQRGGAFEDFYIPIFDPEKGLLPIKNGLRFFLIVSLVITSMAFALSFQPQSTLSNFIFPLQVGIAEQQVTPGAKILFGFYNSPAENAFLYIILGFLVTIEFVIFTRLTSLQRRTIFLIFLLPNILVGSVAWLQIHDLVSGDDSLRQVSHLVFGAEMSAAVLLTGTIIIPEVLHATNNAFIVIKAELGQTALILIFLGIIFLLGTLLAFTFTIKKKTE